MDRGYTYPPSGALDVLHSRNVNIIDNDRPVTANSEFLVEMNVAGPDYVKLMQAASSGPQTIDEHLNLYNYGIRRME